MAPGARAGWTEPSRRWVRGPTSIPSWALRSGSIPSDHGHHSPVFPAPPARPRALRPSDDPTQLDRDGLAAIRVGAIGGLQRAGALDESRIEITTSTQRLDAAVDILQMSLQQVDDVVAGGLTLTTQLKDRRDLGERQPGLLGLADEPQPLDGFGWVVPIAIRGTRRWRHQADVLVVADRRGREAGSSRHFSDFHAPHGTP